MALAVLTFGQDPVDAAVSQVKSILLDDALKFRVEQGKLLISMDDPLGDEGGCGKMKDIAIILRRALGITGKEKIEVETSIEKTTVDGKKVKVPAGAACHPQREG